MGYRSNLYIKATNDVAADVYLALQQADLLEYADFMQDDKYFYVEMSDLKWYDSYDDVTIVNTCIQNLGKLNKACMIREGEESGDVEIYGAEPEELDMYISTYISIENFYADEGCNLLKSQHPELFL